MGATKDQGGSPKRLPLDYQGRSYLERIEGGAEEGWWAWFLDGRPTGARVFFAVGSSMRAAVRELRVSDEGGVSAAALRQIPIGRMEKAATSLVKFTGGEVTVKVAPRAVGRIKLPSSATGQKIEGTTVTKAPTFPTSSVNQKKPDSFYEQVARDYGALAMRSSHPAADLARINDVPESTAHRWIREARRRGLMPRGRER